MKFRRLYLSETGEKLICDKCKTPIVPKKTAWLEEEENSDLTMRVCCEKCAKEATDVK